jgi:hypothetical protein
VLDTGIIEVNDYFTLKMSLLWKSSGIIYSLSLSLSMLIWMFSFVSLIRMFLILLTSLFVAFLTSEKTFKLISHLPNLL